MTTTPPGVGPTCQVVPPELVSGYAQGMLPSPADWSVEAHLPGCPSCRKVLAAEVDAARLDRDRSVLLTRVALAGGPAAPSTTVLAEHGLAERLLARCGVPAHVRRLLSATPSLRRSWLAGVVLVLGAAIGAARFVHPESGPTGAVGWPPFTPGMLAFVVLAPILPLAGVAVAFLARFDPAADLATAAPISGVWLFCLRAVAVIAAALGPTIAAAFAVPGDPWLPLLVVLPALAVSAAAIALATLVRPLTAAIAAGAGWVGVVVAAGVVAGSPAIAYGSAAQVAWLAVLIAAGVLLAARRRVLDFGWNR